MSEHELSAALSLTRTAERPTVWIGSIGPGSDAGAVVRRSNGAARHNVSRLRLSGGPGCHPLARSRSDAKRGRL